MIFSHKKIYWLLGLALGALLLFTDGCSTLKDQASRYQEEVAPILSEFDQIQRDYKKFADRGREDLNYTTQDFVADLESLESRTVSIKESLQKIKVPKEMQAIHDLGILSVATFDEFLKDAQVSLTKQDQVFNVNKTRDQAKWLYNQYRTKLQKALEGEN